MFITLKDNETGYEAVEKYVTKYWNAHCWDDSVVTMRISYDGKNWDKISEIVCPANNCREIGWPNDWWEGQKYIEIIGIVNVDEIDMPFLDMEELK